ncbi:histidine phosphatase superfamily, partial [Mycena albidolilacea]
LHRVQHDPRVPHRVAVRRLSFFQSNLCILTTVARRDRMLASAMNFAIGFFGYPFEGQYQQSITIEADGVHLPERQRPPKADRGRAKVAQWAGMYLACAVGRLQPPTKGYELRGEDMYVRQQLCAYETVALGYSKFCELFTEEEWDGFDYSLDLYFWCVTSFPYNSAFGRPLGIVYVQELVARLTHTPIATHNSSTNETLNDDPTTFPLGQSL